MVKAKVYIYNKKFDGFPKEGDLVLREEELPPIKNGEFLAEAVYLSVDPYMRAYAARVSLGEVYIGSQVAKIVESKHSKYPVGRHVIGYFGWRTHTVSDGSPTPGFSAPILVPDLGKLSCLLGLLGMPDLRKVPLSYFLGILGMPGCTAYFGLLEICQPKKEETVVVSGAAGAVGNVVGQIAKIKGCTVIGIAGSEEKGKWLKDELGFDHFINYKTDDIDKALSEIAPSGIDCYFDNAGGETTAIVTRHLNTFARVALCGSVATYNVTDEGVRIPLSSFINKQVKIEGFVVNRWIDRFEDGVKQHLKWLHEGKLKQRETVTDGFENMFKGFVEMLQGKHFGKAVIKV